MIMNDGVSNWDIIIIRELDSVHNSQHGGLPPYQVLHLAIRISVAKLRTRKKPLFQRFFY
jgi:hypothetical protein